MRVSNLQIIEFKHTSRDKDLVGRIQARIVDEGITIVAFE